MLVPSGGLHGHARDGTTARCSSREQKLTRDAVTRILLLRTGTLCLGFRIVGGIQQPADGQPRLWKLVQSPTVGSTAANMPKATRRLASV
jgi:hypothetical protein